MQGLFNTGTVIVTEGASQALRKGHGLDDEAITCYLHRHLSGDWGDVPPEDAAQNEENIGRGGRIISSHTAYGGKKLWVITEGHRRMTTIMTPDEY